MKQLRTPLLILTLICIGLAVTTYSTKSRVASKSSKLSNEASQHHPLQRTTFAAQAKALTPLKTQRVSRSPKSESLALKTEAAETESPLALKVCQSETLSQFADPSQPCAAQVNNLKGILEKRIDELTKTGVALNTETCVATDLNGETSDLDSILSDLGELTKWLITQKVLSFGPEMKTFRHRRVHLVAACSVLKTIAYWGKFPGEIPSPENIPYYLHFDVHAGKPRESQLTGSLVIAFAFAERTKREFEKLN